MAILKPNSRVGFWLTDPPSVFALLFLLAMIIFAAWLLLVPDWETGPAKAAQGNALAVRGEQVFRNAGCFSCHSVGALTAGKRHTGLRNQPGAIPPDLTTSLPRSDDWLLAYLISPSDMLPFSPMASYGYLPEADLKAVIAYLQNINKNERALTVPLVDPQVIPPMSSTMATYQAGLQVYQTFCQSCHGERGKGNGPVGPLLSPQPRDFTDAAWLSGQTEVYLFSVVSYGKPGTAMPGYNDILTLEQRSQVLNYIGYFADPVMKQRMELPARGNLENNRK